MTLANTPQIDQLAGLARRLQGASSFQSAQLAKEMVGVAEEVQRQQTDLATGLLKVAQPQQAVPSAAEDARLAVESAATGSAAEISRQLTGIAREFERQRQQMVTAITEAVEPSRELYQAAREIRFALESMTKPINLEGVDKMVNDLYETQARFERVLESQAELMRNLMETLVESVRKRGAAPRAEG